MTRNHATIKTTLENLVLVTTNHCNNVVRPVDEAIDNCMVNITVKRVYIVLGDTFEEDQPQFNIWHLVKNEQFNRLCS
jgi:hypothetical protein